MRSTTTKQFQKDLEKAKHTFLLSKIKKLIEIVKANPFQTPPPYEKLKGEEATYSRRINEQHRLVYIVKDDGIIFDSCWSHYE